MIAGGNHDTIFTNNCSDMLGSGQELVVAVSPSLMPHGVHKHLKLDALSHIEGLLRWIIAAELPERLQYSVDAVTQGKRRVGLLVELIDNQ